MIKLSNKNYIAYFCAEFGIDNDLPTYSGGLGVLAGDLMSAAADQNYPMIGIGILYKGKSFMQHITGNGKEEQRDSEFDHDTSFLRQTQVNGNPLIITIPFDDYEVFIKPYHIRLSDNTILFFLSTDVDGNPSEWISDMNALYRGNADSQIRQQIILGVGGVKLLKSLKITPKLYHINEGRPEFIIWEIASDLAKNQKISYKEAFQKAKEKIVYTNHTLVEAGNIKYPAEVIKKWATPFAKSINVDKRLLIKDGLVDPDTFSTTLFAINISKTRSAVSTIHGKYVKNKWPSYDFIPITNGIHLPRWQDSDFRSGNLDDNKIWNLHMVKKKELVETVKKRTGFEYDPNRLVVTWARRLAQYKQPKVIFNDIARLKAIFTNSQKPVQLLFAGNSHSGDINAKSIIEDIINLFSSKLSGNAIFVPNYNISLANHFVSGSDLWLNTPKGNLEACGTSGMKAIANGVLNCTVVDGWTYEVDWNGIGWVLDPKNVSESFYNLLEKEIIPTYYDRSAEGLPLKWIQRMKKSIELSKQFSAEGMLNEYKEKLYSA